MQNNVLPERPVIVILDGHTLNPGDLSWDSFEHLGEVHLYPRTLPSEVIERAAPANIILTNKVRLTRDMLVHLPNLRCICVTATGYNNIDVDAAAAQDIIVCNAVGYGTASVAQHVFALLLACTNSVAQHHDSVRRGAWSGQPDFSYWNTPLVELEGKMIGIYGFGKIGQRVATLAQAFGMSVLVHSRHPQPDLFPQVTFVDLETLFAEADVVSLNAALSDHNRDIIGTGLLQRMKPNAILINTSRGELIVEEDLLQGLQNGRPAMAALDVLRQEPPDAAHPLFTSPNCIITPHQAWASREARQRLLEITLQNVQGFLGGAIQNRVFSK